MAAPVVTARIARALAEVPKLLNADRTQARSDAINKLVWSTAIKLGFKGEFQGHGRPA
jgi:hypothetical protein